MSNLSNSLQKSANIHTTRDCLILGKACLSYIDLDIMSNKVINFLTDNGVQKGDRVGIYSEKSFEEVAVIFATFKAGFILVHINPAYKDKQLLHVCQDCDVRVIFIDVIRYKFFQRISNSHKFDLVVSFTDNSKIAECFPSILTPERYSEVTPFIGIKEDDVASIIYTSGSTGSPKGIIVTHNIIDKSTRSSISILNNSNQDKLLSISPFSFDGSLSQLMTMIYVGGVLVLQKSLFPKDIVNTILNEEITGIHAVPTFWRMLLEKHSPFMRNEYPTLKYISIIGEAISTKDLNKVINVVKYSNVFMMYGITEAFRSTYNKLSNIVEGTISVGLPFPGVNIEIINSEGKPCSNMQIGEIVHSGNFVSPGYWNDQDKTKKVFKQGKVYTGDLGLLDNDGMLYFKGRKDQMMKVRGFRVSPDEIEACLLELPEVTEVIASSFNNHKLVSRIIVFIGTGKFSELSENYVLRHCKLFLPYYMIPNRIIIKKFLPKTGNGKINRSILNDELSNEDNNETL